MADAWTRVDEILHSALLRPRDERDGFLRHACAGDTALEREVRSLLAADDQAGSFLDDPAIHTAARALADDQRAGETHRLETARMALSSGNRLGPYEISAQIGAGGMGEVYRAIDTNLARPVAIKVLPEPVAANPDRLARFDGEARTLAALNHPNIAAIYGLERSGGTTALVMELVEGPTLADRIAQGAMPVAEALPIARQIADALEAAHEQRIIHRDLKPANIKLRPDGTVKVLDFGLAKQTAPLGPDDVTRSLNPSLTGVGKGRRHPCVHGAGTGTGKSIRRPHGPLCLRIGAVRDGDREASVSRGVAGQHAGQWNGCGDPTAVSDALTDRRPPEHADSWTARTGSRPDVPKSAAAVRQELLALGKTGPVRPATMAIAVASVIGLAAALWWSYSSRPPARRSPDPSHVTMITTHTGDETTPSVSPDGALVAFSWPGKMANTRAST
jgi:hypothetical protein